MMWHKKRHCEERRDEAIRQQVIGLTGRDDEDGESIEHKFDETVSHFEPSRSPWERGLLCLALLLTFIISTPARAQDITTGLVGYWKMDETTGATITDSSSTANNGVWTDGTGNSVAEETITGKLTRSIHFDGVDNMVTISNNAAYNTDGTWAVWVKSDGKWSTDGTSPTDTAIIMGRHDTTASFNGISLYLTPSTGRIGLQQKTSNGGAVCLITSTKSILDNNWHHIAIVYARGNGATTTIYVDGVADGTCNNSAAWDFAGQAVRLGDSTDVWWEEFQGELDDVRVYNRMLTAADVDAIYRARDPGTVQYNTNTRTPEYFDGASWVAMGKTTYVPTAATFDSIYDYLTRGADLNGNADSGKFTVSFWFKVLDNAANKHLITTANSRFTVRFTATEQLQVRAQNTGGTDVLVVTTSTTYADGNWHHALVSADMASTSTRYMYIDGALIPDARWAAGTYTVASTIDFTDTNYAIGATTAGGTKFWGDVADLWFNPGTYINLSVAANRVKFIQNGRPVYLGSTGELPTGTAPKIFLSGAFSTWQTNDGTGGGFTVNGALAHPPNPFDPVSVTMNTMGATIPGAAAWAGGALGPDGKIYGIPYDATDILIINSTAGTATNSTMGATLTGSAKWIGGVAGPDRKVYGIPHDATDILIIDTVAGTATRSTMGANLTGNLKWGGGVRAPNGKIYGIPFDATDILIIDTVAGTATRSTMGATLTGTAKWSRGVLGPNGKIYGIPFDATDILIIDPVAGTATRSAMGASLPSGGAWITGVVASDGKIYGIPYNAPDILIIDPAAGTATSSDMGAGMSDAIKWVGGVLGSDGKIYGMPADSLNLLVIDPATGTAVRSDFGLNLGGAAKWVEGYTAPNGKTYGMPFYATAGMLIIDPRGACANPARPGGTILFNTTRNVMQYCNGSAWIAMGKYPGAGGGGCANPSRAKGYMMYNTSKKWMQYCDGTNWIQIGGLGTTIPTSGLVGYWRLDETTGSSIADSSGTANAGTWSDGSGNSVAQETGTGKVSKKLHFDGVDDVITIPNNAAYDMDGTYALWMKTNGLWGTDGWGGFELAVLMARSDGNSSNGVSIWMTPGASGTLNFQAKDGSTAVCDVTGTKVVGDNAWHHVAAVYSRTNGATSTLYIDGAIEGTCTNSGPWGFSGWDVLLGDSPSTYWEEFQGDLDDVRIYNRALSSTEVRSLYLGTGGTK